MRRDGQPHRKASGLDSGGLSLGGRETSSEVLREAVSAHSLPDKTQGGQAGLWAALLEAEEGL